jgi:TusA-related sulfurtransferase
MGREQTSKIAAAELDLRGVPCPLSWAKAKVRLEGLPRGATLTLLLDDPRGVRDIPRAAEAEGYAVDGPVDEGAVWRLAITR